VFICTLYRLYANMYNIVLLRLTSPFYFLLCMLDFLVYEHERVRVEHYGVHDISTPELNFILLPIFPRHSNM
jgi:hypothetical protein